jgi:hypothetical protein
MDTIVDLSAPSNNYIIGSISSLQLLSPATTTTSHKLKSDHNPHCP